MGANLKHVGLPYSHAIQPVVLMCLAYPGIRHSHYKNLSIFTTYQLLQLSDKDDGTHLQPFLNQSIAFLRPASTETLGCQSRSFLAREMSGQRVLGSSIGSGRKTILLLLLVSPMIFFANSNTVYSSGLPRLTGSLTSESISV